MNKREAQGELETILSYQIKNSPLDNPGLSQVLIDSRFKSAGLNTQDLMAGYMLWRDSFYQDVAQLAAWGKSSAPDPKKYGKDAVDWVKYENITNNSLISFLTAMPLITTGEIMGYLPLVMGGAALAGLSILGMGLGRFKTDTLEYKEDSAKYIKDLSRYNSGIERFALKSFGKSFDALGRSLDKYIVKIKEFSAKLKDATESDHVGVTDSLDEEAERLNHFQQVYKEILGVMKSSKKLPVYKWSPSLSVHSIGAEGDIVIGNIRKMIEDYKALPENLAVLEASAEIDNKLANQDRKTKDGIDTSGYDGWLHPE